MNVCGEIILQPRFEQFGAISEELMGVCKNEKWGFADLLGDVVISPSTNSRRASPAESRTSRRISSASTSTAAARESSWKTNRPTGGLAGSIPKQVWPCIVPKVREEAKWDG